MKKKKKKKTKKKDYFTSFGQPPRLILVPTMAIIHMFIIQTVCDVVENPQMVLLGEKGPQYVPSLVHSARNFCMVAFCSFTCACSPDQAHEEGATEVCASSIACCLVLLQFKPQRAVSLMALDLFLLE